MKLSALSIALYGAETLALGKYMRYTLKVLERGPGERWRRSV
jgi:hypothetical protein